MISWELPVDSIRFVGSTYAEKLAKLKIQTIKDLLYHFPFRYDDLSQKQAITDLVPNQLVTLSGTILHIQNTYLRSGRTLQKALFSDGTGQIEVTWFNQPYLVKNFTQYPHVSLSGKVKVFRGKVFLQAPQFERLTQNFDSTTPSSPETIHTGRLVPVYHETAGVSSKWLRSRISPLIKKFDLIDDWLPQEIKIAENFPDLKPSLEEIHFPSTSEKLQKAISRLSFDELFVLQLIAQVKKQEWTQQKQGRAITLAPEILDPFYQSLPFNLTSDQQKSISQILQDLQNDRPMNRLLQGDVGSGKTAVAAAAMYCMAKNGLASVLMAPTEVLAHQHAKTLEALLSPLGLNISVQTRSRKDTMDPNALIVGTHALLHRPLPKEIGLVIIDEQHRFGVEQRVQLLEGTPTPHLLSMTATPIPRTIALTLYAQLDISTIKTMPHGREPVKTWVVSDKKRPGAYQWIRNQVLEEKSQIFVVCPIIEDSENPQLEETKAAETEYERLKTDIFPDLKIGLLHGRMKAKQKETILTQFSDGKLDILVATPVIEVGIDIPNATVMMIEGAERFGLAQLHQLRGRVGRGNKSGYCLLLPTQGKKPSRRLKEMEKTHSGYDLAELDLKLRGPGDLYGTKQSGYINLKLASLADTQLIQKTYQYALKLINQDPDLSRHPEIQTEINYHLAKNSLPN